MEKHKAQASTLTQDKQETKENETLLNACVVKRRSQKVSQASLSRAPPTPPSSSIGTQFQSQNRTMPTVSFGPPLSLLSPTDQDLRQIFSRLDKDRDGKIDINEFQIALHRLHLSIPRRKVIKFFQLCHPSFAEQLIPFRQFIAVIRIILDKQKNSTLTNTADRKKEHDTEQPEESSHPVISMEGTNIDMATSVQKPIPEREMNTVEQIEKQVQEWLPDRILSSILLKQSSHATEIEQDEQEDRSPPTPNNNNSLIQEWMLKNNCTAEDSKTLIQDIKQDLVLSDIRQNLTLGDFTGLRQVQHQEARVDTPKEESMQSVDDATLFKLILALYVRKTDVPRKIQVTPAPAKAAVAPALDDAHRPKEMTDVGVMTSEATTAPVVDAAIPSSTEELVDILDKNKTVEDEKLSIVSMDDEACHDEDSCHSDQSLPLLELEHQHGLLESSSSSSSALLGQSVLGQVLLVARPADPQPTTTQEFVSRMRKSRRQYCVKNQLAQRQPRKDCVSVSRPIEREPTCVDEYRRYPLHPIARPSPESSPVQRRQQVQKVPFSELKFFRATDVSLYQILNESGSSSTSERMSSPSSESSACSLDCSGSSSQESGFFHWNVHESADSSSSSLKFNPFNFNDDASPDSSLMSEDQPVRFDRLDIDDLELSSGDMSCGISMDVHDL